ncbi:MAG: 50S ribosomal protein L21 [Candidatus Pacebacteria bacterium CG10_big_fil_rev_8_21_14_0_10_56_10]|nr:MAG: 50S ribosomal protein L21 [Candidatus Pacebacteria bacterium CG10_big_fil_rev_8_21_14_0_10_56_10]
MPKSASPSTSKKTSQRTSRRASKPAAKPSPKPTAKKTADQRSKTAVIQLAGKQFLVSEGDVVTIDKTLDQEGGTVTVSDVLLVTDGNEVKIGTPTVAKASVQLKVQHQGKSPKLRVATFKAKSRYRRVKGHRQPQTMLETVKIKA